MKRNHVVFFDEDRFGRLTPSRISDGTYVIGLAMTFFKLDTSSIKSQLKYWIETSEDNDRMIQECQLALSNFDNIIRNMETQHLILLGDKPNPHLEYEMFLGRKRRNQV